MQKILFSITLCSFHLHGAQTVSTKLTFETGPKASESYKKNSGVVEIKNYVDDKLVIQILDSTGKPLLKDKLYIVPAATGSKQDQLGYLRLQFDSSVIKKQISVLIYDAEVAKLEDHLIKAGEFNNVASVIGVFKIEPNATRQRILASIEKPKGGNLTFRPQSSAFKGLGSYTGSGIPTSNSVTEKEIKKNLYFR